VAHVDLDRAAVARKTGDEPFVHQGGEIGARLRGFWSWACSDLIGNAMRGVLAEYIVGLALGCVDDGTRVEWDATDLRSPQGLRVEVKSSAYVQSWKQDRLSKISFDIKPAFGWGATTNVIAGERARQADVYVFCLFTPTDKTIADPLNLDQWDFYVMSTSRINKEFEQQKTISLGRLRRYVPAACSFAELADRVETKAHGGQSNGQSGM